MGMFGPLTRSSAPFYPGRLLCKRFGFPAPTWTAENVPQDQTAYGGESTAGRGAGAGAGGRGVPSVPDFKSRFAEGAVQPGSGENAHRTKEVLGLEQMEALKREAGIVVPEVVVEEKGRVDPERNEALEVERPGEAVFKAIFGSDSEDD